MEDFPRTPERLPLDSNGCPCRRHQSDLLSSGSLFRTPHPKQELCECSIIREQFLAFGHEIEGRIHLDHGAPRARSSRFCEFILTRKLKLLEFGSAILAVNGFTWIVSLARPTSVTVSRRSGNGGRPVDS